MKTDTLEIPGRVRVVIGGVSYWRTPEQAATRRKVAPPPTKKIGPMRTFMGEVLREERIAQGKSLREISDGGISMGFISEIERGRKEPSSETLETLCSILGLDVVETLRRTADRIESSRN